MRWFLAPTRHDQDPETGRATNGRPADAHGRDASLPGGRYEYARDESQCLVWVPATDYAPPWAPPLGWRELTEDEAASVYTMWRGHAPRWS
jgi:hypothetical protein